MPETKTTAKAAPKKPACPSLPEKFNKIIGELKTGREEALPIFLTENGITFDVISEDAVQHSNFWQRTQDGLSRLVWIYESDLTVRWTNAEKPSEKLDAAIHVIGSSCMGPASAKLAAWDSALATYFASKFWLEPLYMKSYEEDATSTQPPQGAPQRPAQAKNGGQGINTQQNTKNPPQAKSDSRRTLTGPQMDRMYKKADAAGITMQQVDEELRKRYNAEDPYTITRAQYDEICRDLDDMAHKRQGGQPNE